jgi:hypothetical protein
MSCLLACQGKVLQACLKVCGCRGSSYVEEAMRALVLGCMVVALGAGCGSTSGGGSPRTGPTQVNLKITTAGNGLVRGAGADCRGSCTASYVSGTQVHLVAVADSGSSFVAWAGACSGTGGCDLTLDADRDVSATLRRHLRRASAVSP